MVKLFIRVFMGIHVFLYRLTGGKFAGKVQGLRVLLLNWYRAQDWQAANYSFGAL